MKLSFFPRGLYHVENMIIKCKRSNSILLYDNIQEQNPYAILFVDLHNSSHIIWDITAFRPNILENIKYKKNMDKEGILVTVFFEIIELFSESVEQYKIPRYLLVDKEWYVNTR